MYKFVPGEVRHAWWPVEWKAATDDGEPVTNRIEMRFKLLDDSAYQTITGERAAEFDARWADLKGDEREKAQRAARADYAGLFVEGWRGIGDEHGQPAPWEPAGEFVRSFLQMGGVMDAVLLAHAAARRGARPNV